MSERKMARRMARVSATETARDGEGRVRIRKDLLQEA